MLFDINNYNLILAVITYFLLIVALFTIFKNFVVSYADPLIYHLIWIASNLTFLVIYFESNNVTSDFYIIFISQLIYLVCIFFFFGKYLKRKNAVKAPDSYKNLSISKWQTIVTILFLCWLYSYGNFFLYALTTTNFSDLFSFRFQDLQGRDPIMRVMNASSIFLNFFLFYGIQNKIRTTTCYFTIVIMLVIAVLSGGRSAVLNLIFSAGAYTVLYSRVLNQLKIKKINKLSILLIVLGSIFSIIVSGFYAEEFSLLDGATTMFNRIFASSDGLEYYFNYVDNNNFHTGFYEYFMSIFGFYLKSIFGIDYKNIGWQLIDLASGTELTFAQGPNYTFLLQGIVINKCFLPIYTVLVCWVVSRLRYLTVGNVAYTPFKFAILSISFLIPVDLEYFVFMLLSLTVVYSLFVYPLMSLKKT